MERMNFVRNGVSRLPPGFRFQPTEQELVFEYLKCKILSLPLPASIIPDLNLCNFDPWDLPGNCDDEERYFFSPKETKYRNGNRMNRTTISGYWKATGSDKRIACSTRNENSIIGIRKTLVFYQGNSPNGYKTDWIMHEYRLVSASASSSSSSKFEEVGDWVLCRISLKKTNNNNGGGDTRMTRHNSHNGQDIVGQPRFFDFMMLQNQNTPAASTSSSCSSSNNGYVSEQEETSGYAGF